MSARTSVSLATAERADLCALLDKVGSEAPTLCEGWLTRDLAAHLVLRESRPDAAPGIVVPRLAGWTQRVQDSLASGDFRRLVHRLRTGPPLWSPFRLPRVGEAGLDVEFFVHHEDVRRAHTGWRPRELSPQAQDVLWRRLGGAGRFVRRSRPVGIELVRDDTGQCELVRRPKGTEPTVTITGPVAELVMFAFGRREHALVRLDGPAEARAALEVST